NQPGSIWTHVTSRQDVINELGRLAGKQIGVLWLYLHGSPGIVRTQKMFLQSIAFDASTIGLLRNVCFNALTPYAWIYWLCGNLGQGPAGDAFLRAAGPAMLGRGGSILASTSVLYPPPPLSGWADARGATVSPGGAAVSNPINYRVPL
ncbi:hypothetical protein, partial [Vineibacter terrae]|uniref:hypothetical protein n=1 Tax=Vineibacter terrae TaxID=2586908 RepID=UPI002E35A9BB